MCDSIEVLTQCTDSKGGLSPTRPHSWCETARKALLPAKCLCGRKVGDGAHLFICKKVNAGQIAAHDDRSEGDWSRTELLESLSDTNRGWDSLESGERKWTDMELRFDGKVVAVDFTVPNTITLKQHTSGLKYRLMRCAKP